MSGWDGEALARLRAAVHQGDGAAGCDVLRGRPMRPVLQYAGDVLVAALAQGVAGADALARECVQELRRRGAPGDAELADEVAGVSRLAGLPVDLGAVAAAMDDGFHVLDVERGDVIPVDEGGEGLPIPPGVLPEGEDARRGVARRWLAEQGFRRVRRGL
ncbi:hypothetical protein [Actinomadura sp. 7K507]|uniref:hypothetical protein n=1 Tax=Actinomadura sp. 7K507 TaxID=2530365 RepID=UPI0010456A83|nr:hypothetical protein [Actinomadura sp. 7K507]TDC76536.1 hypothetical protein E1285_39880 [Actinomadura sp. 7K507]